MALLRDLVYKAPPTAQRLIVLEREKLKLNAVKKVTVMFDPFRDDVHHIRKFAYLMNAKKTTASNPKCIVKTEILTDRSEHRIHFELTDGKEFIFKCANLKLLEIFQLMNKYITPLTVEEEEDTEKMTGKLAKKI